jgi:hypothetical protein
MTYLMRRALGVDGSVLTPSHRVTHTYVIGQPGTGKSRALESWILQDIAAGHGVAVIDPHGDLFTHLVARLSTWPHVWERLVILDPCDPKWVVSFNPLQAVPGTSPERVSLFLTDVMLKIWRLDVTNAPRLVWLLTNTCLALSNVGLTLVDVPRFLLDSDFRASLLPRITHPQARAYFADEFPKTQAAAHQWATPLLNKIGGLVFDADIRLMVAGRSTFNFRQVLDEKRILLVHIPKGIIGEGPSALLGAFIVAHLQKAALSRANTTVRPPYYVYLDEFQNYTTDNIRDILSESRKYALSMTLAHQYLDQLSPDLQSAVLNTTGTLCCFRVGYHDAYDLAKEMFPSSEFLAETEYLLRLKRFWRLPVVAFQEKHDSLGWEGLAHQISNLPPRQFWARQRIARTPAKLHTLEMPDPLYTPERQVAIRQLHEYSGRRYGRLKKEVADEIARGRTEEKRGASRADNNGPWWGN